MQILFFLLLFLTSCVLLPPPPAPPPIDPTAFSEIIIPYSVELKYNKRLRFEDSKVYYDGTVKRFMVYFSSQAILELCECRALMVYVVEGLLDKLNSHPGVTEYFDHFPITATDLELYFCFESNYIEYDDPTYIHWMSLHDGLVRYVDGLMISYHQDFWHARIEPYYKAKEFTLLEQGAEEEWSKAHPKTPPSGYLNIE